MAAYDDASLTWPDIVVVVVYFVIVLGTGILASCRGAKTSSVGGFFLAGRDMHWIPIGASAFSTNISAGMFLGMAGSAAASGIAVVMFEWQAMWMLLLLGWVFLPVYMASGCSTMPEYLKLRFGGERIRIWISVIATLLTVISKISGQLYVGSVFIQQILKWNLYPATLLILAVTAIFSIIGGMTAVIWTDTIQTGIIIIGAFTVSGITLARVGGFEEIRNQFLGAAANYTYLDKALYDNHSCGFPPSNAFHIFRPVDDSNYPWTGMVFGLLVLALNSWCIDQLLVQRALSARNVTHAKAGVVFAAYLKILSFVFFVIPGMISRVLYPDEVACADPDRCMEVCGSRSGCYDIAYPLLVLRLLPQGVRGLMMAALLSALVSTLTSIFNSSSAIVTVDLWPRCRPKASQRELMVVGRLIILVLVGVSIVWLPALQVVKGSQYWSYAQSISSFMLPPIVMTYLFGLFWTRTTEQGAFWGLIIGFCIGVIRMGLEWSRSSSASCGNDALDERFSVVTRVHYLHFAAILSVCTSIIIVVISLLTEPVSERQLRRVTWWTRNCKDDKDTVSGSTQGDSGPEKKDEPCSTTDYHENTEKNTVRHSGLKYFTLKWLCGVDLNESEQQTTIYKHRLQLAGTDIREDPFWKKIVDANGLLCCACCFFLHGFWA